MSTQSAVALSSAKAELNAIVKSMAEILGLMHMTECGRDSKGHIFTDSSAANGVVHRQRSGKMKHLECRQLWVQETVELYARKCRERKNLPMPNALRQLRRRKGKLSAAQFCKTQRVNGQTTNRWSERECERICPQLCIFCVNPLQVELEGKCPHPQM